MYPTLPSLEYSTAIYPPLMSRTASRRYEAVDPTEVRDLIPLSVQSSDDYGLLLQVVFDGLLAVLAAYARVFHPSERKLVVAEVELVHPGHACLYLLGGAVDPLHVVRVDGGAQTIGRVIGEPYRLVHIVYLEYGQQWPEGLLAHHAAVVRGVLDHGRLEEVAFAVVSITPDGDLRAPVHRVLELICQHVSVPGGVKRTHPYLGLLRLLHPVAELVAGDPLGEALHKLVVDFFEDVDPLGGEASLARVEKAAYVDPAHGRVHVRVGEDDHRVGSTQFRRNALELGGRYLHHPPPCLRAAREGDPLDVRVGGQRLANLIARTRYDVQNPGRELGLLHQLGDAQRGERGSVGRLHHDRVASGERRSDLGPHQREREVVGHDRGTHSDRLLDDHAVGPSERRRQVRVHTFDLASEVSIVVHPVQEVVKLPHRLGERLALLAYQELRDLLGVLLYLSYPGPHQLGAVVRVLLRPLGERFLRRGDRRVHVLRAALWNRVERLLRRRVYDRRLLAGPGSYLLSAYQGLRHARYLLSLFRLPNTPVVPCT